MRYLNNIHDLRHILGHDFKEVILVGGAEPLLRCEDINFLKSMKSPVFVYMNHGVNAKYIQDAMPANSLEILFLRKRPGDTFHGLNGNGSLVFKPRNRENFLGTVCINSPVKTNISQDSPIYYFTSESAAYKRLSSNYDSIYNGKPVSPTTGYICESLFKEIIEINGMENIIYLIGMKLDNKVPRFPSHNIDYEQKIQERKVARGELKLIGDIAKSHVPIHSR